MKLENKNVENEPVSYHDLLRESIKTGDVKALTELLQNDEADIDIDQLDWNGSGNAPILDAAIEGQVKIVRVLCENGCNVNARTSRGETALHMAVSCRQFNAEMINLLLTNGCNPDIQHNLGRQTALHMFIKKHVVSTELNSEVLNVFESLVKASDVNKGDDRLRTPLHYIASSGKANLKLLQILLDHGANPNLQNDRKESALHEALQNNSESVADILITRHTNLYLETIYKETPLHIAARKNMIPIVKLLLEHDVPINAQDLKGNTALHLAASKGYNDVVQLLVEKEQIQLNISNNEGFTPLHLAVDSGFIFTVEILLKADSCDLTARTKRSETALDLAQHDYRRRSQPEMIEVLSREIQRRSCGKSM